MSAVASGAGAGAARSDFNKSVSDAFANVDTDQFLQLMITELQNQDPLDPTDSSEFLQQITQIREIGASDRLTDTLDRVLAGQNLALASGLIGREVTGIDRQLNEITGVVDRVSMFTDDDTGDQTLLVHVGAESFPVENVKDIKAE